MKTIIFDLGNVVVFFDHRRAFEKLCRFTPLTPEEMYAAVYGSNLCDAIERGTLTTPAFLAQVKQRLQIRCELEYLAHALGDIFWPNPEVCELIPKLKSRYRIVAGSNTSAVHARRFFKQFANVLSHFDALGLSYELGTRKPEPEFYHACLRLAKGKPNECVFIDDLPENIEGARAVGLHGIVYRPNEGLADKLRALGVEV